jgi:hypothetical protein
VFFQLHLGIVLGVGVEVRVDGGFLSVESEPYDTMMCIGSHRAGPSVIEYYSVSCGQQRTFAAINFRS